MGRFSEIFLIFFLLTGISGAPRLPAGERIYLNLHYEDLSTSPWGRAADFGERLKRLARQALPPRGHCFTVNIVLAEPSEPQTFSAKEGKHRLLRVTIPRDYAKIEPDMRSVTNLTAWLLLANLGVRPEHADKIRDSWYVTGLARKALSEMHLIHSPFSGYFPAAYAFGADGILPTLRQVTAVPLRIEDSAPRLVYEEYCELLLELCSRSRLFREGFLAETVRRTLDGSAPDGFRLFAETAGPAILKRNPGILKQDARGAEREKELEKWFRGGLERLLTLDLLPASVRRVETEYRAATRFQYRADGSVLTGSPADFVHQWDKMERPWERLTELMNRLLALGRIVPPDLAIPLSDIRSALSRFRTDRSEESLRSFQCAESAFFRAMERHIALERMLEKTERHVLSPATRYFVTFPVLNQWEKRGASPSPGIDAFLNAGLAGGGAGK